jgi:hypothetical protein
MATTPLPASSRLHIEQVVLSLSVLAFIYIFFIFSYLQSGIVGEGERKRQRGGEGGVEEGLAWWM